MLFDLGHVLGYILVLLLRDTNQIVDAALELVDLGLESDVKLSAIFPFPAQVREVAVALRSNVTDLAQ